MKVGDYVRYISVYNNEIKIRKINAIIPPDNLIEENYYKFNDFEGTIKKDIVKSSPNIIDLIEVGDIVKYNPIMNGYIKKQTFCKLIKDVRDLLYFKYQIEHKKANFISIVTKEQFESMEYKVGE